MQIHRLFDIVYLLIERRTMTTKDLADRLEVSTRTILRDIEVLSGAGIPLYATRGRGGGISLMDGYVLSKAFFSESEQSGILAALQQLSATQFPSTQPVLTKLKGIFVKQTTDWLEVDFSHWGSSAADKQKMSTIQSALMNKQALRFQYSSAKGETAERLVYPLKLWFKSMSWYIAAYCTQREDYRTFKLNRMQHVALADQYFGDLALKAPPLHIDEPSTPRVPLTLLFDKRQAHRVYDEFAAEQIKLRSDGQLLVTVSVPDEDWLYSYLLTFGSDLEILAPPEIRNKLIKSVKAVLETYR